MQYLGVVRAYVNTVDLSKLVGWRHSLSTCIGELNYPGIKALHNGVMGIQSARQVVLNRISRNKADLSRRLASQVLDRVEKELQATIDQWFGEGGNVPERAMRSTSG
ncbi:hypothetical protein [Alcaligenes sp. Marseille-Q7550]